MKRSTDKILTTHCGKLPAPSVMDAFRQAKGAGDARQANRLMHEGIGELVRRQLDAGIDVVGDGEFYKPFFTDYDYYSSRWSGIERREAKPGDALWFGHNSPEMVDPAFAGFFGFVDRAGIFPDAGYPAIMNFGHKLVVSGPLEYRGPELMQKELAEAKTALQEAGVDPAEAFYPQLSPGWLGHFLFNEHYPTEEEWWYALAEAWRGEYEAIVEAGFILQLDDPALADKYYMFNPPLSIADYRKDAQLRVEATNHCLRNIPEDRIRYHMCWGSWHFPHTTDIGFEHIVDLLLQVNAQTYLIEASNARHQLDYKVWEDVKLPDGKILAPGVVGHATSNVVEAPEVVAERIVRYAKILGRENVMAGTDCGLGGRCHDDVAWAKLRALAEGAALASRELWG